MNEATKRGQKLTGGNAPSPMGSAAFRGTQGSGPSSNPAKGYMGSGKPIGSMAKGVQGKG